MKGLTVKGLFLTEIRKQPVESFLGCLHGIPSLYSQNVDSHLVNFPLRGAWHSSFGGMTSMGIDLPAWLQLAFFKGLETGLN